MRRPWDWCLANRQWTPKKTKRRVISEPNKLCGESPWTQRGRRLIYRSGGCSKVRTCWQRIASTLEEETSRWGSFRLYARNRNWLGEHRTWFEEWAEGGGRLLGWHRTEWAGVAEGSGRECNWGREEARRGVGGSMGGLWSASVAMLQVGDLGNEVWWTFVWPIECQGATWVPRPMGGDRGGDLGCDAYYDRGGGLDEWSYDQGTGAEFGALDWTTWGGRGRHEDPHCRVPVAGGVRVRGCPQVAREDDPLWRRQPVGEELGQYKKEQSEGLSVVDPGPKHAGDEVQCRGGLRVVEDVPQWDGGLHHEVVARTSTTRRCARRMETHWGAGPGSTGVWRIHASSGLASLVGVRMRIGRRSFVWRRGGCRGKYRRASRLPGRRSRSGVRGGRPLCEGLRGREESRRESAGQWVQGGCDGHFGTWWGECSIPQDGQGLRGRSVALRGRGPQVQRLGLREEMFRSKGWKSVVLNFVTTEFGGADDPLDGFAVFEDMKQEDENGEGAARSRCALVAWRYEVVSEDVGKFVVRSATARPMATIVDSVKNSEALVWKRPYKVEIEPGIPRDRLLPQVVGHFWMEKEDDRANLHGLGGPMRWPLRAKDGCREVLWVHDRQGPSGCVRKLNPMEILAMSRPDPRGMAWSTSARSPWREAVGGRLQRNRFPIQPPSLVLLAGAVMTEQMRLSDTAKAGTCKDQEGAEAMAKLLTWLRRWRQGEMGLEERWAGGCALAIKEVTRLGDAPMVGGAERRSPIWGRRARSIGRKEERKASESWGCRRSGKDCRGGREENSLQRGCWNPFGGMVGSPTWQET